jgi:hypothetical protein
MRGNRAVPLLSVALTSALALNVQLEQQEIVGAERYHDPEDEKVLNELKL